MCDILQSDTVICCFTREIEYLKKETQRCAQVGAEASLLKEESGQLQEQVRDVASNEVALIVLLALTLKNIYILSFHFKL